MAAEVELSQELAGIPIGQPHASRRQFLKAVGIGGAVIGVGGLGTVSWRASNQGVFAAGSGPAYAAWQEWDQGGGPMTMVRAAVLSANPHNTQPWHFRPSTSAVDLYADPTRNIGAMDPYRREQQIGLGCALENLLIAGQARGYEPQLKLLPDSGDQNLIAHVELGRGDAINLSLYQAIPRRHAHRGPFDASRAVSSSTLSALDRAVADIPDAELVWVTSDSGKRQVGQLIVDAAQAIAADHQQSVDSFKWWRDNWSDIQRFKDGLTVDAAALSPMITTLAKILPPQTREQNDHAWIQQTRDNYVKTAAAFGFVMVRDAAAQAHRINGGRLYQRLHLSAVGRGLAMQPLNTVTERIDREQATAAPRRFADAVRGLLSEPGWEPLMSFRIGYATSEPRLSPRRPADSVLN
jgi:nitroreductase